MKIKGGLILFILAALSLPGFFVAKDCSAAGEVVINEIAWAGSLESSYDEWIELQNNSGAAVDLTGWKLAAADGSPKISLSGVIPAGAYFLLERTDDGASPAAADQFYSGSLDNNGEALELKDASGQIIDSIDFSAGWPFGDNAVKTTLQRCGSSWSSSAAPLGTPKADNYCSSPAVGDALPDNDQSSGSIFRFGDLLINEFFSNPSDGGSEWVEIYDPSGAGAELTDWYLSDGSGAKTFLDGGFGGERRFFLIEKPKGALNNAGDEISLFSPDGNLIDRVAYGDWGSSTDQNAPAPGKGWSAGRKEDGLKNGFLSQIFSLTSTPTPGLGNKISVSSSSPDAAQEPVAEEVFMTEVLPNPLGSDRESEFVEFYNRGDKDIDLSGWRLEIRNGKKMEFGKNFLAAPVLKPKDFFVLWRTESRAALDNNGSRLELFKPGRKTPVQILEYPPAGEGESFSDTQVIDNGRINSSTKSFLLNTLTIDRWVWTEAPTPGKTNEIKVKNRSPKISFSLVDGDLATGTPIIFDASDSVDEDGDQVYFKWDFGDGTLVESESVAHIFLKSGEYRVRLEVGDGKDKSFLEREIIIPPPAFPAARKMSVAASANQAPIEAPTAASAGRPSLENPAVFMAASGEEGESDLKSFSALKIGTETKVSGQVLVVPGAFGKQYFYVIAAGSPALKIYNYYGEFPKLREGDNVSIKGEAAGGAEKYLKTRSVQDIKVISSGDLPAAETIDEVLDADDEGRFVEMSGVIRKSDGKVFLSSEFGETRIFLKNPTDLSPSDFTTGQGGRIRGLVIGVSSGQALAPRGAYDLFFDQAGQIQGAVETSTSSGTASAAEEGREWVLPERNGQNRVLAYAFILALAGLLVLGAMLVKEKLANRR